MGFIQKDALRTMLLSYIGLFIGYLNRGVLFIIILTTEQIGLVNLIITVGLLFAQIASLGVINTIWKFLPFFRDPEKNNYGFLKLILLIVSAGVLIATIIAYFFKGFVITYYSEKSEQFVSYYYWIIPLGVANILFLVFENYLRGIFKNVFAVFVNEILLRLLITILLVIYAFKWINFEQFLIIHFLAYFVPVLILLAYLIRIKELTKWNVPIVVPTKFKRIIVKYGVYSYMNNLGTIVVTTLDSTMIASYVGLSGTGIYMTILYLTSALQIPYRSLYRISSPLVPVYWKERKMDDMEKLYKDVSSINLIVGLFMFLLVWLNRNEAFELLPKEYAPGMFVFLYLMIGKLFDMYMGINTAILVTSKKYYLEIIFTSILLTVVFVLNHYLIPIYGIVGAAISTMLAYFLYNLLRLVVIWKIYDLNPFRQNQLVIFFFMALTLVIAEFTSFVNMNYFVRVSLHTSLLLLLFVLPIYLFKVEPLVNDYVEKVKNKIFKR